MRHECDTTGTPTMSNLPEPHAQPVESSHPPASALSLSDLWLRCFALGTMNTPTQLAGFLQGELRPTRHEYNLVVVALNEYLMDIGVSPFVRYIQEDEIPITVPYLNASWSRSAALPGNTSWCDQ